MSVPMIISYYTDTWEYKAHGLRLAKECDDLHLQHHIKEYDDTGSWMANTRLKSKFILETLKEYKTAVLWVDVDASIHRHPVEIINPGVDFMSVHQRIGPKRNWHVGVMYFAYNDRTVELLERWVEASISGTDEASFESVWVKYASELGITSKELPNTYYMIAEAKYNIMRNPVISHTLSKCPSKIESKKKKK